MEDAIRRWQLENHVPDDDPALIFLNLARLSLRHACAKSVEGERIPSFGEYRDTIELMDTRSKVGKGIRRFGGCVTVSLWADP